MLRHLPLAGLCLAVFLAMTGMGLAGVALPEHYLRVAGSPRTAGWLSTAGGFLDLLHCAAILLGAGLGGFAVASMALVNKHAPEGEQATASALAYLIWVGGYFAGPQLANLAGLDACIAVLAVGALAFPALLWWRHHRRRAGSMRN